MVDFEKVSSTDIAWCWYRAENEDKENKIVGKFMTFYKGPIDGELQKVILEALAEGATPLVKHTNPKTMGLNPNPRYRDSSTIIWYSSDDKESLQKVVGFLIKNNLIRKTKTGKLYNISFKYDAQTIMGEYGDDFTGVIKLEDLVNLNTGELL